MRFTAMPQSKKMTGDRRPAGGDAGEGVNAE